MSVIIAFFPKCPMCWAVYMSMLSGLGFAELPYMGWLLPFFLLFFLFHLLLLYRKIPEKGIMPFVMSLLGFLVLCLGKWMWININWIPVAGMSFIIAGSLLNNFSGSKKMILR
ncbi:hypothetical protein NAT51_06995 [Flavobacterium amniphilum]|uniref:hypothetical protein n=1 Tax=Flavobacterium amniphilum TaxID=1834035 RepID=UPI002029D14C|nr:hypothetical protein [Flavobacterium amniphilum]MCL9805260.1 hypothetical protein [Flavobacterium amniphilum]